MNPRFIQWYFNLVYTPVYDFGVAQSKPYRRLQSLCLDKLTFQNNDRVLCIGIGTGNEIIKILEKERNVAITGIDTSQKALDRAYSKSSKQGKQIVFLKMDAHKLNFADETFDQVLCLHVMGFLKDDKSATQEIARVLKKDRRCVITYPSGIGSVALGWEIAHCIWHDIKSARLLNAAKQCISLTIGSLAYIPISPWVKPSNGFYSNEKLADMLNDTGFSNYAIYEDKSYQDYIVSAIK